MANIFHISEVLDMGIEKEKKRRDFYALVAKRFNDDQELNELFSNLRDWEEMHVKKISAIKEGINEPASTDSYAGELNDYIRALVDEKLYSDITAELFSKSVPNALRAIDYGLQFERDAILFFSELWRYVPEYSRKVVDELIEEERKHVLYLTGLRRKYDSG